MPIPLQEGVIYGPLRSRRFGNSLGVNLLPNDQKVCSFDCLYCQYGETNMRGIRFPTLREITDEAGERMNFLSGQKTAIDWIMIAGNGEPTLHPDFHEVIHSLITLRNRCFAGVPIGILSNASTCYRPEIQETLWKLDGRFMKLDAGNQEIFSRLNQPAGHASWGKVISGLYQLRRIVLQSMFVRGHFDNTHAEHLEEWIEAVAYIRPESVQVYTIDRPTSDERLLEVPRKKLEEIAHLLTRRTQIPATIYD